MDDFVEADEAYKELEQKLLSGDLVIELYQNYSHDLSSMKAEFLTFMGRLQEKLSERNTKFQNAKTEMRKLVQLEQGKERGPDGSSETRRYGPLTVNSVTNRSFDPTRLMSVAREKGILNELMNLTMMTKEGVTSRVVQEEITIDYQNMHQWLLEKGLEGMLNTAYREKEGTPQVKGAKPIAFLGDKIDK